MQRLYQLVLSIPHLGRSTAGLVRLRSLFVLRLAYHEEDEPFETVSIMLASQLQPAPVRTQPTVVIVVDVRKKKEEPAEFDTRRHQRW